MSSRGKFQISRYRFNSSGLTEFAAMLVKNDTLQSLNLSGAEFKSENDLMLLRDALIQNSNLTSVKLPMIYLAGHTPFLPLNNGFAKAFVEIAKFNPWIQELQIILAPLEFKKGLQNYLDRNKAIAQCEDPIKKQTMLDEVYKLRDENIVNNLSVNAQLGMRQFGFHASNNTKVNAIEPFARRVGPENRL